MARMQKSERPRALRGCRRGRQGGSRRQLAETAELLNMHTDSALESPREEVYVSRQAAARSTAQALDVTGERPGLHFRPHRLSVAVRRCGF